MALFTGPPDRSFWKSAEDWAAVRPGRPKLLGANSLPAQWVIHTVGPVWRGGGHNEDELLAQCYRSCFALADKYAMKTITFRAISAGA